MNITSLHNACSRGDVSVIKRLLEEGVDVNCADDVGSTPLHQSVNLTLLSRCFNKNGFDKAMVSNFIIDISEYMTKMLISGGAFVNLKDTSNRTPLHIAAFEKNYKAIRILLESNSDVNLTDKDGKIALHYTALSGDLESTRMLLESGCDINATDLSGNTPLHFSVLALHFDVCELLIEHKSKINAANKWLVTPYLLAARINSSIVKLLLENGANDKATDHRGLTALHTAVSCKNIEVAFFLLKHCVGIDINSKDCSGETALFTAVAIVNCDIATLLLIHGADVNTVNNLGETPIHSIISQLYNSEYPYMDFNDYYRPHLSMISTLLDYHADLTVKSKNKSALDIIMGSELYPNVKQRILEYICKIKIACLPASKRYSDSLILSVDHDFRRQCEQEVEFLKKKRIENASFYQLLKAPTAKLVSYLRNNQIESSLAQGKYKEFIIYSSLLKAKYSFAAYRNELIKESSQFFASMTNIKPLLNYDCIEYLLSFLANRDLQHLSLCVKLVFK